MYQDHFGLKSDPFGMTPDPKMLHMTVAQREALAGIMYGVLARRGFIALIGEAGTGKTTLLNKLMQTLKQSSAHFSVIFNPMLTAAEFLESALADFGVEDIPESKAQRLLVLNKLLLKADEQRSTSVLIVDEAHKLSPEVLEEIRLLSNFERAEAKLLQIILAGQPQLAEVLDRPELRQLKQRVAVRLSIDRLSAPENQAYIARRWMSAGGGEHPFTPSALQLIARCSDGIPRMVNSICDNSLMLAMAEGVSVVTAVHVREAAKDLAFLVEAAPTTQRAIPAVHVPDQLHPARQPDQPQPAASVGAATSTAASAAVSIAAADGTTKVSKDNPTAIEEEPIRIPMLERYGAPTNNSSVLSRLLGRLGLAN
jgi:general secretion pathway protein A